MKISWRHNWQNTFVGVGTGDATVDLFSGPLPGWPLKLFMEWDLVLRDLMAAFGLVLLDVLET